MQYKGPDKSYDDLADPARFVFILFSQPAQAGMHPLDFNIDIDSFETKVRHEENQYYRLCGRDRCRARVFSWFSNDYLCVVVTF